MSNIDKSIIDDIITIIDEAPKVLRSDKNKMIAWLEKQGEHANFRNKIQIGDKVTRNEDGILVNISQLNRIAKLRVTKPADKVEPKFHEGDFIVNKDGNAYKVEDVCDAIENEYRLRRLSDNGFVQASVSVVDRQSCLWDITKDAKDGDILASNKSIFIFQEEYICEKPTAYCGLMNGLFIEGNGACWTNEKCYPATKEQCDLLFTKMKEAGYKWDEDKKGLRKIENQGEQIPIIDGILTATNYDKMFQNCNVHKFKVGDWITNGVNTTKIIAIGNGVYVINRKDKSEVELTFKYVENNYHLWTISDAKDGDVLMCGDKDKHHVNITMLFKSLRNDTTAFTYFHTFNDQFRIDAWCDFGKDVHPTTKEQQDLFFQRIKEAGYLWNANTYSLKCIKPTKQQLLDFLDDVFYKGKDVNFNKYEKEDCEKWFEWVQKQSEKPQDKYERDVEKKELKKLEKQGEQKEYTFKSIPRLLDMIEPTSKAKAYCQKLIDTLVKEGYSTDAKIVGECLKQMNGEKVALATMDEKQVQVKESDISQHENKMCKENDDSLTSKTEAKFKVGDWITDGQLTCKILSVTSKSYELHLYNDDYCHFETDVQSVDKHHHLWTIQDAKDGDVLYSLDSNRPFIYKERNAYEQATAHCGLNIYGKFFVWGTKDCVITLSNYVPATKEQRDLLFQKMKETGYEWDDENKELKKIEQKSTEWSADDEKQLNDIIELLPNLPNRHNWLKSLKQRMEEKQ